MSDGFGNDFTSKRRADLANKSMLRLVVGRFDAVAASLPRQMAAHNCLDIKLSSDPGLALSGLRGSRFRQLKVFE
jgi:hypothetical protein